MILKLILWFVGEIKRVIVGMAWEWLAKYGWILWGKLPAGLVFGCKNSRCADHSQAWSTISSMDEVVMDAV